MSKSLGRYLRVGLGAAAIFALLPASRDLLAADGYVPFDGPKTTWHEGFDRYDFIMDDATGAITPMTAPASEVTIQPRINKGTYAGQMWHTGKYGLPMPCCRVSCICIQQLAAA